MIVKSFTYTFISFFLICCLAHLGVNAQSNTELKWINPINSEYPVVSGKGWENESESIYHRLVSSSENDVRKPIWELAKHSAGLSIRFWTNSKNINIKYKLKGKIEFPHMPATGVSGVDLYKKTMHGDWQRLWGEYALDSISNYAFLNNDDSVINKKYGSEFQLFLPLYNEIEELTIGIDNAADLRFIPLRKEKPIVAYGTSICQGASASRPGMAWTNILERKLERPVINLGFSGNGKLEPGIIELITQIDAKVYILDCLPNLKLVDNPFMLTINAVKKIKEKHPNTPLILTSHSGFSNANNNAEKKVYSQLNEDLENAFILLQSLGYKRLYLLKKEDLGLQFDSYVDNVHPNDIGMQQYANAYEKLIRSILRENIGSLTTTIPKTQSRDIAVYNWEERHQKILELNKSNPPKICWFGDSITHFWGGQPQATIARGQDSWDTLFENESVRNFGFGWDRIENVLWRIHHDELDGFSADKIILMLGTNNLHLNNESEILEGLEKLITEIKYRQPKSEILILGILPRVGKERQVSQLNLNIGMFALEQNIEFNHIGNVLLLENHKINEALFSDGLHPNNEGYKLLSEELKSVMSTSED